MSRVLTRGRDRLERLADSLFVRATAPEVQFVVLGRSRTGSNLLTGMLNTHPRALVFGELFQNRQELQWGLSGYPTDEPLVHLWRHDPVAFLEQNVFTTHPRRLNAVGFKLFYYHAHDPLWEPLWSYLVERQDIHILHIKRSNILRTVLSRKRAALTNTWVNTSGERQKAPSVALTYAECLQAFTETRQWELDYGEKFRHHSLLDVTYEELVDNQDAVLEQVQRFLHLRVRDLSPHTYRQAKDSLPEAITNYAELKAEFAGSPWAGFFED